MEVFECALGLLFALIRLEVETVPNAIDAIQFRSQHAHNGDAEILKTSQFFHENYLISSICTRLLPHKCGCNCLQKKGKEHSNNVFEWIRFRNLLLIKEFNRQNGKQSQRITPKFHCEI